MNSSLSKCSAGTYLDGSFGSLFAPPLWLPSPSPSPVRPVASLLPCCPADFAGIRRARVTGTKRFEINGSVRKANKANHNMRVYI